MTESKTNHISQPGLGAILVSLNHSVPPPPILHMSYFRCQITSVSIDNSYFIFHNGTKIFMKFWIFEFFYVFSISFSIKELRFLICIGIQCDFNCILTPILSRLVIKQIAFVLQVMYVMYGLKIYLYIPSMSVEKHCKFMNVYWSTFTRNLNVLPICFKNRSS